MNITETLEGSTLILALHGRLDSTTAKSLEDVLPERMQVSPALIVDLAEIQYVSSAGLRVILKAAKVAKSSGNRLVLAGLAPQVHEVFQVSGFTALFNIQEDRSQALAALA
ncbi:STAS domain-containing protein [Pseudomonas lopnurensis]|uniref:STAS domain-containing protein n=1 Tax=Pseudomonas lopnurensis TaxID=1477517 RepID=UPI00187AE261|nr:STAS domain-containing protein [Pseudomonas lopnurensis]MBE7374435.1 STAS domain-containing protein [Pseudomonas lopnurensis]